MQGIAILGATGSIGRSALAVLEQHRDRFRPVVLTARSNRDALEALVRRWQPEEAVLSQAAHPMPASGRTRWTEGREALLEAVTRPDVQIVINALVGAAGLEPTVAALRAGKRVALANKESLVCGGRVVLDAAEEGGGELIPIDSEHSAILQCLRGNAPDTVQRLILTASGGPFREFSREQLASVAPSDALRHPTWEMGSKISIDSATLANKALEIIEAHFLFGIVYDRIGAVVHPQSVIHSMVEFVDGSVMAQMGFPTMEVPILYALSYPERIAYVVRRFDPVAAGALSFEALREDDFPAFRLGVNAGIAGGGYPAVYNAANEVAVQAFLTERLPFNSIANAIDWSLEAWNGSSISDVESVLAADRWARVTTETFIGKQLPC